MKPAIFDAWFNLKKQKKNRPWSRFILCFSLALSLFFPFYIFGRGGRKTKMTSSPTRGTGLCDVITGKMARLQQTTLDQHMMTTAGGGGGEGPQKRGKKRSRVEVEEEEDEEEEGLVEEEDEEEEEEPRKRLRTDPAELSMEEEEEEAMDIEADNERPVSRGIVSIRMNTQSLRQAVTREGGEEELSDSDDSLEEYSGRYTSIDKAYARIVADRKKSAGKKLAPKTNRDRKRLLHIDCFLCELGDKINSVGWTKCINYLENGLIRNMDRKVLCRDVSRIFNMHTWLPRLRAHGGQIPPGLKFLSPAKVMEHILNSRSPYYRSTRNSDSLFFLTQVLESQVLVEGAVDVKLADVMTKVIALQEKFNDKHKKEMGAMPELQLDPRKLYAIADMSQVEALLLRGADALGGATAHGSTASMLASARDAAPNFGASMVNINPMSLRMRSERTSTVEVEEYTMPF
jgi:hypothetical protein